MPPLLTKNSIVHKSPNVRRTRDSLDEDVSPFVLDAGSVKLQHRVNSTQYAATFLQTPVTATLVASHRDALSIAAYLDRLRHPHLEPFVGVMTDRSARTHAILTERQPKLSVAALLERSRGSLTVSSALKVAFECALGLHYLHHVTRTGHHALCAHALRYDCRRGKTVVMLTMECVECKVKKKLTSRKNDVQMLAHIILALLKSPCVTVQGSADQSTVSAVVQSLRLVVDTDTARVKPMKELCALFSAYL